MDKLKDYTHGGNIYKAANEIGIHKDKIIDFSANINPLGLSKKGLKAIKKSYKNILNYPDPGYTELQKTLSGYYSISTDYLFPGNGAIDLLYTYASFRSGKRFLIPGPGFVEYEKALHLNNCKISIYNNKSAIKPDSYDAIIICNPNNPTGEAYSYKFLKLLLQECKESSCDLFIDEAFIDYSSYKSLAELLSEYDNLYILKSLTKFYAIPGLRLGAILTSNSEFKEFFYKRVIPWSINAIAETYVNTAVKDSFYITKSTKYIKKERVWLFKELSRIKGIKVYRSQGNYLMFKVLNNVDILTPLRKKGILIRSCKNYNNLDDSYYRVAIKLRRYNRTLIKELAVCRT